MNKATIYSRELEPDDVITAFFYSPPFASKYEKPLLLVNDEYVDNREAYMLAAEYASLGYYEILGGNYVKHNCEPIKWKHILSLSKN